MNDQTTDSKIEITDEQADRLIQWMRVSKALETKSNREIAQLLIDHVWSEYPLGTAKSELISEAANRLSPELLQDEKVTP